MFGGLAVGLAQSVLSPYASLSALPLRCAVRARDRRALCISRGAASSRSRGRRPSGGAGIQPRAPAAARARAAARTANDRPRARSPSFCSRSRSASCRRSWARTGSRRSRASPSTRSRRSGFGILYGRVGMISLGQVALLDGRLLGRHAARLCDLAPVSAPAARQRVRSPARSGVLVGLPALRLSGLYLALITLMFAGATTIVLSAIDFPNGGGGFKGRSLTGELTTSTPPVRRPSMATADTAYYRYTVDRRRGHVPARAAARLRQARARLGVDPRERARRARGGRQHHPLQALGLRARVVHHRRRRLPARGAGGQSHARSRSRPRTRSSWPRRR